VRRRAWVLAALALVAGILVGVSRTVGSTGLSGTATARTAAPSTVISRPPLDRYSLVHGCYRLRSGSSELAPSDGPYRMQATALGRRHNGTRLLYRVRGGRIAWVGAVTGHDGARLRRLRGDILAAGLR
jgi:hypothetical protein